MVFRIDDRILATGVLRRRMDAEACFEDGTGAYRGYGVRDGGALIEFHSADRPPPLASEQIMFGQDMARALNRHLHHDGGWIVLFTHPEISVAGGAIPIIRGLSAVYGRWAFIWLDRDGDPQFTMDNVDEVAEVLMAGPDHWIDQAEQAWAAWSAQRDVLDVREGETFKRALGETAASAKG